MTDHTKWMETMMEMTRTSFDAGMRNMEAFPKQAEKAMNLAVENANLAQDESRKAFDTWMSTLDTARQAYADAFKEGMNNLEQQIAAHSKGKK